MHDLYGDLIGIDHQIEDMDIDEWYEKIKKTESRIDRADRLCVQLFDMDYLDWHNKCHEIWKKENALLPFLYKRLAGHAIWLRREHVKQQCEIVKKISEVQNANQ